PSNAHKVSDEIPKSVLVKNDHISLGAKSKCYPYPFLFRMFCLILPLIVCLWLPYASAQGDYSAGSYISRLENDPIASWMSRRHLREVSSHAHTLEWHNACNRACVAEDHAASPECFPTEGGCFT